MRAQPAPQPEASALLCSVDGCRNWWTSDHGRRLCGFHLHNPGAATKPLPLPTRDAARPFSELSEPDEEYVHG